MSVPPLGLPVLGATSVAPETEVSRSGAPPAVVPAWRVAQGDGFPLDLRDAPPGRSAAAEEREDPEDPEDPDPLDVLDVPDEPSAPARSAGRNLPAAIAVGTLLGAAVVVSLLTRSEAFVGVAAIAVVLGIWEVAGALATRGIMVPVIPLGVGSLGMLVSAFVAGEEGLLVSFTLTAFGVLLWRVIDGLQGAAQDVVAGIFTAAYVPFLAGFAVLMLSSPSGRLIVLVFVLVTVASDIGGYVAGVLFGLHPMAPSVSPKKSWEGFAGSTAGCVVAGVVAVVQVLHGPWWVGVLLGVASVVAATLGDLSESLLKRDLGIKDMSTTLPGHGGVMDRLDSLLFTAPVSYLILTQLLPAIQG